MGIATVARRGGAGDEATVMIFPDRCCFMVGATALTV
jgi:hypothetical protein